MKFISSILGTERDRLARRRRCLEVSLHRLEEKTFLLEMELEETRRERQKVIDELRTMIPPRMVPTVSMTSTDFSFSTTSTNETNAPYCGRPIVSSTPKINEDQNLPEKSEAKAEMFRKEEEERDKWLKKHQEKNKKSTRPIEKY